MSNAENMMAVFTCATVASAQSNISNYVSEMLDSVTEEVGLVEFQVSQSLNILEDTWNTLNGFVLTLWGNDFVSAPSEFEH